MLHAYRNPMRVFDLDDLTMLVGPSESASMLEIGGAHAEGITAARIKGISWQRIGGILGTSAQAAQQRYGAVVESA